jgi:hypothetical protein
MRLWSLHPQYLDSKGLLAVWREGLLAKKVLQGQTRGYRHHSQLIRFKQAQKPIAAMNIYLRAVYQEAMKRGYHFDRRKVRRVGRLQRIPVTAGQLQYETVHLLGKLVKRDAEKYSVLKRSPRVDPHPLFRVIAGDREPWEKKGQR